MGTGRVRTLTGGVLAALFGLSTSALAQPVRPGAQPVRPGVQAPRPGVQPVRVGVQPARPGGPAAQVAPTCPECPQCVQCPPPPPAPPPPVLVAVSAALNGGFADLSCGASSTAPVALSAVAGQFAGEGDALRIDAGDLVGNAAVARLSVDHDAAGIAGVVRAMGYRALALGHRDIAGSRASFIAAARAISAAGVPHVLSNLHCDAGHPQLCEVVQDADDPPVIIEHAGQRIALVALAAPSALAEAAADRRAGLTLDPLADAITREVQEARAAGATKVIVALDPGAEHSQRDALELANSFEPGSGPDVVLVHDLPSGVRSMRAERSGTLLVAAREAASVVVDLGPEIAARAPRAGAAPEAVTTYVQGNTRWLCETYGRTLPGGRVSSPMSQEAFAQYTLDVMRDTTRSEVAVINRRAFKNPSLFPLREGVSTLLIQATLPYEDTLQRASVTGAALKAFITAGRSAGFFVRGLEVRGGAVFVNGRAIDDAATYTVVTTGFVAESAGDGVGANIAWERHGSASPQEILASWLQTPGGDGLARTPTDPANHTRWALRWTVDGQFANTWIQNEDRPTLYSDAQLSRARSVAVRVDSEARADADHPAFTWLNGLRIRYGTQEQSPPATNGATARTSTGFVENLDLIALTTKFTWRYFRSNRQWYHPLPFVEGYGETEFDLPPQTTDAMGQPTSRQFHHWQFRPTAGATFELLPRMTFDLGVGADWAELSAPSGDPRRTGQFNMLGRLVARPGTLFTVGGRSIDGGFSAEVSFRDPGGTQDLILRVGARLSVPLFNPLKLTLGYDLYGRQVFSPADGTPSPGFAFSGDATIGLTLQFAGARQTW